MIPVIEELRDQLRLIVIRLGTIEDNLEQLEDFIEGEDIEEDSDHEPDDLEEVAEPEENKPGTKSIRDIK